jgi:hypothetical protein
MSDISRRAWLKGLALLSVAGKPLMLASTPAEAKVTKAAVHYRDSPKGMQMCHMCKYCTGTLWPDVIVAVLMATLALQGSVTVVRQSLDELSRRHSLVVEEGR